MFVAIFMIFEIDNEPDETKQQQKNAHKTLSAHKALAEPHQQNFLP